jgi:hypothetical protein
MYFLRVSEVLECIQCRSIRKQCIPCESVGSVAMYCMWECRKVAMFSKWECREGGNAFYVRVSGIGNVIRVRMLRVWWCIPCKSVWSVAMFSMWECRECGNVFHVRVSGVWQCFPCESVWSVAMFSMWECWGCGSVFCVCVLCSFSLIKQTGWGPEN